MPPLVLGCAALAPWNELIFNKCIICSGIHCPCIHFTSNIAIHCYRREDTKVDPVLGQNRIRNYLAFWSPTMCSRSNGCIDARFIEEKHLVRGPLCNLSNPGISEYLISLGCFFCKLILANNSEINLLMRDAKFLENNAESPNSDRNIVSVVDFC